MKATTISCVYELLYDVLIYVVVLLYMRLR